MNIFDLFSNKAESEKKVGQVECQTEKLPEVFMRLMETMNMTNPRGVVSVTSKAISIVKDGDKYIITLNSYTPPVKVVWTKPFSVNQLIAMLQQVALEQKKVGFINTTSLATGDNVCQLALA